MAQLYFLFEIEFAQSTRMCLHEHELRSIFRNNAGGTNLLFVLTRTKTVDGVVAEIEDVIRKESGHDTFDYYLSQVDISKLAKGVRIKHQKDYNTQATTGSIKTEFGASFKDNDVLYFLQPSEGQQPILVQGTLYELPIDEIKTLTRTSADFKVYRIVPGWIIAGSVRTTLFSDRYADSQPRVYGSLHLNERSWKYTLFKNVTFYLPEVADTACIESVDGEERKLLDMVGEDVDADWIPKGAIALRDEYGHERDWDLDSKPLQFGGTLKEMLALLHHDHKIQVGGEDWLEGVDWTSPAPTEWRICIGS